MKILIITKEFPPQVGGIPTYTYNIAKNWINSQKNVIVLSSKNNKAKDFDSQQGFKIYRIVFNNFYLLFKIWRLSKKSSVDLLHLHCAYFYPFWVGWFIDKIIKVDYRLFLHSVDFNYLKKSKWTKRKMGYLIKKAKEIIVNSEYLKDQFSRQFEDIIKPINVVYPCADDYFFAEVSDEKITNLKSQMALEGKKVVITVARLDEGKGFPRLISILPKVLEKIPNLVWIIIGDGSKRQMFINLISKNNLQNVIRYIGIIPNDQLLPYYKLADLFILLTHPDNEAEEDWATVFMESSASGLPILAGKVGGVEEAIKHLQTGVLVDVNDKKAVVNGIVELLKNENYARQMGEYGKEWVKNNFSWKEEVKKLLDV